MPHSQPPMPCPKCQAEGRAFAVTVKGDTAAVDYRCPDCRHEWTVTRPSEPIRIG